MNNERIDSKIFDLYDEYCHTPMDRRSFLSRAAALGGLAMAQTLLPDYVRAAMISFTDERIKPTYAEFKSPGGNGDRMRGYLVQPVGKGPFPAVLVIHENRGLNPYIKDVARRAAVEGFLAFAPDALTPLGGYPGNDDDGKILQRKLDRDKIYVDMKNAARFLKGHPLSNGKLGVTGFCFGGAVANHLAVELGSDLQVSVPFYGGAPDPAKVKDIKCALVVHYAQDDPRVNAMRSEYEKALKEHGVNFEMHSYPGTRHGFHNNSTPRYDEKAAALAWERTLAAFKKM